MKLKQKGYWRKMLGLKGHLFYFASEEPPKARVLSSPAIWSTLVATLSTISTAIFAFQNYRLTRETHVLSHPPRPRVQDFFADHLQRKFSITVVNTGDTPAKQLRLYLFVQSAEEELLPEPVRVLRISDLGAHASTQISLGVSEAEIEQPHDVSVRLTFLNITGEAQENARFCAKYDPAKMFAEEISCEAEKPTASTGTGKARPVILDIRGHEHLVYGVSVGCPEEHFLEPSSHHYPDRCGSAPGQSYPPATEIDMEERAYGDRESCARGFRGH